MQRWRALDLMRLYDAARAAGLQSFVVFWTSQRLERGELTLLQATVTIDARAAPATI